MIKIYLRNILRFVVLVLIQVLVINNLQLSSYVDPFIYVLFILLLPFETPGWILLLFAFSLGLTIDMFSDTAGVHASATVFTILYSMISFHSTSSKCRTETWKWRFLSPKWLFLCKTCGSFRRNVANLNTSASPRLPADYPIESGKSVICSQNGDKYL